MATLQEAVSLIKQGRKPEAQKILQDVLKTSPQDVSAWFWFAETFDALEKKEKVLETCLRLNPGHPQAVMALDLLRKKIAATAAQPQPSAPAAVASVAAPPEPVVVVPKDSFFLTDSQGTVLGLDWDKLEKEAGQTWGGFRNEAVNGYQPAESRQPTAGWSFPSRVAEVEPAKVLTPAIEALPDSDPSQAKGEKIPFYRVWWLALTDWRGQMWPKILEDPEADGWRALEWLGYLSLGVGLLFGGIAFLAAQAFYASPEAASTAAQMKEALALASEDSPVLGLFVNLNPFFNANPGLRLLMIVAWVVLGAIFLIGGVAAVAGVEHLLAKALGGKGSYSRVFYAISAYHIPFMLASTPISAVSLIPRLGPLLYMAWSFYPVLLNVRAVAAAHKMDTLRAAVVVGVPMIFATVFVIILCLQLYFALTQGSLFPGQ